MSPVFVEFRCVHSKENHFFVGKNLRSILKDTKGGECFGFAQFSSCKEVDEREVMMYFSLRDIVVGMTNVQNGKCASFYLGTNSSSSGQCELL